MVVTEFLQFYYYTSPDIDGVLLYKSVWVHELSKIRFSARFI
jgi:hypothetical protein